MIGQGHISVRAGNGHIGGDLIYHLHAGGHVSKHGKVSVQISGVSLHDIEVAGCAVLMDAPAMPMAPRGIGQGLLNPGWK